MIHYSARYALVQPVHYGTQTGWPATGDLRPVWDIRLPKMQKITIPNPTSKPIQFTMALIPGYLRANNSLLSAAEVKMLEAVLADYDNVQHEP
jgi:hypothetical protein